MIKKKKSPTKKWSLFDVVGIYSSGVKMTLKALFTPMETTSAHKLCLQILESGGCKFGKNCLREHPELCRKI